MRLLTLLFTCLAALPAAAEPRQHGNVILDIPEGWTSWGAGDNGILELHSDLPDDQCEFCTIHVTPGEAVGGTVDRWLTGQTRRFLDASDNPPPAITPLSETGVTDLHGHPAAMLGQMVDGRLQMLFAIQLPGRMELFALEAPAADEEDLATAMQILERDFVPMIEGVRFVSDGAAPLMPAPAPGDLEGVWWGTRTTWIMGLDGMMQMQLDHRWLTFWPDGIFYDGTAPAGRLPFDRDDRLAKGDMGWGSYRVDGDRLTLGYASGEVADYSIDGEALSLGDLVLYPVELLPDGTPLDGMISSVFYSGFTPGSGVTGGASAASETHFRPDGTWDFGASGGAFGNFDGGGGFATSSERSDRGRYEVTGGLVIRYGEDGEPVGSAYAFRSGEDIWVGSQPLATGD